MSTEQIAIKPDMYKNSCQFKGQLVDDVVIRETEKGEFATFTMLVGNPYKNREPEKSEEWFLGNKLYLNCIAFGSKAIGLSTYKEGDYLYVEGPLLVTNNTVKDKKYTNIQLRVVQAYKDVEIAEDFSSFMDDMEVPEEVISLIED